MIVLFFVKSQTYTHKLYGIKKHFFFCNIILNFYFITFGLMLPYNFLCTKIPWLSTHWANLICRLGHNPFHNAMHMKTMGTHTPNQWTIISGHCTFQTTLFKWHTANATAFVIRYPFPGGNGKPI